MTAGRFDGQVVLVTGAARPPSIGWHVALSFAREGADLVCVDRVSDDPQGTTDAATRDAVDELSEAIQAEGVRYLSIDADVTDPSTVDEVVAQVLAGFGRIDHACCLSGTSGPRAGLGNLIDVDPDSWQRCVDVNLTAPFLVSRAVGNHMVSRGGGGSIVILSSYAGLMPSAGAGAIGVARAGVNFLVEVLAVELGPHGIRVNAVCPLGIDTPSGALDNSGLDELVERAGRGSTRAEWAQSAIPLQRLQSAEETASVVRFLASDDASFVSGQSISVAGGTPA